MPPSIQSMGASAQLNTAWNITNSTAASISEAADRMQQQRVDAREPGVFPRRAVAHRREHAAQVRSASVRRLRRWSPATRAPRRCGVPAQCAGSMASMSASAPPRFTAMVGSTGTPSSADSRATSIFTPRALRDVHAIERQHHRQSEPLHLERQPQPDRQMHRVDHAYHQLGCRCVGDAAQQHVARDGFVERGGIQAVGAGQIEHAQTCGRRRRCVRLRGARR